MSVSSLFQNKSLKNKLLSGHKLCDAYAEEVRMFMSTRCFIPSIFNYKFGRWMYPDLSVILNSAIYVSNVTCEPQYFL